MRKIIWFAILSAVVTIVALSYNAFILLDEAQPVGTSTAFAIREITSNSKADALNCIAEEAKEFKANIYKDVKSAQPN